MGKRESHDRERKRQHAAAEQMQREAEPLELSTEEFLGDVSRASLRVERSTTYGLGGVSIHITGGGEVAVDKSAFGPHEQACTRRLVLPRPEVEALFAAFVVADFGRLVVPERAGYPDMVWISLELTNHAGQTRRAGTFFLSDVPALERLVSLVRATVGRHLDEETRKRLTI